MTENPRCLTSADVLFAITCPFVVFIPRDIKPSFCRARSAASNTLPNSPLGAPAGFTYRQGRAGADQRLPGAEGPPEGSKSPSSGLFSAVEVRSATSFAVIGSAAAATYFRPSLCHGQDCYSWAVQDYIEAEQTSRDRGGSACCLAGRRTHSAQQDAPRACCPRAHAPRTGAQPNGLPRGAALGRCRLCRDVGWLAE